MSRNPEIQLGKEAAGGARAGGDPQRGGRALAEPDLADAVETPQANAYPYYFKLINDESTNAFALPGGPMYVHTGLLRAADSEGEVAGVLAHEMSHVALRHGAAEISKQQRYGTLFQGAGSRGRDGDGRR